MKNNYLVVFFKKYSFIEGSTVLQNCRMPSTLSPEAVNNYGFWLDEDGQIVHQPTLAVYWVAPGSVVGISKHEEEYELDN